MAVEDNVFRWEVHAEAFGQSIINHIDYVNTDPLVTPTGEDLEEILGVISTYWADTVMDLLPQEYLVEAFYLKEIVDAQITSAGPPVRYEYLYDRQYLYVPSPAEQGDLVGDVLPTYCSASIWKTAGSTSRNYRASLRFGPILEDNTIANSLDPTFRAALGTAMENMRVFDTAGGVTFNAVVLSGLRLAQDTAPTPLPKSFSRDIVHFIVREYLGTQLSRKRRLG